MNGLQQTQEKKPSLQDDLQEEDRYLLFCLGDELYGTPLLGIREIVEPQPCKPIPNTVKYFLGVINLRGQIVGVIDLRARFSLPTDQKENTALMVFDTAGGLIAAMVDKVHSVAKIPEAAIDTQPNISTNVPLDYLLGIGKHEEHLISIIDLKKILNADDLVTIRDARLSKGNT